LTSLSSDWHHARLIGNAQDHSQTAKLRQGRLVAYQCQYKKPPFYRLIGWIKNGGAKL
jgi:hypothetical protein